jgi:hypothetical protein
MEMSLNCKIFIEDFCDRSRKLKKNSRKTNIRLIVRIIAKQNYQFCSVLLHL